MPKHPLLEKASANISNAMDKIEFKKSMTSDAFHKIQSDIQEAKSALHSFNEVNADTTGFAALLEKSIQLVEKSLHAVDCPVDLI